MLIPDPHSPQYPRSERSQPLISVVIRSLGRDTLAEALDSVAAQTYRQIEIVLVDVRGDGTLQHPERCGEFPLRRIATGSLLSRGAAANAGLAASSGAYVIFLDDDDWFLPEHLAGLVQALRVAPGALAAYAGVECRAQTPGGEWQMLHVFNQPYDPIRLLVENYLPIHAVLFSRSLVEDTLEHAPEAPLRFDETLEVYEDWDFWIQLSALTELAHLDRVTAVYRIARASGFGLRQSDPVKARGLAAFFAKWRTRWSLEQLLAIVESAKYRSMYHELREQCDQELMRLRALHTGQLAEQYAHFERVRAEASKLPELTGQLDRTQVEMLRSQTQCAILAAEQRALNERLQASEAHCRLVAAAHERDRDWLRLLGIETLEDVFRQRDELTRFHAFHGRILAGLAGIGQTLAERSRWASAPLAKLTVHLAHLAHLQSVYGLPALARALGTRLRLPGTGGAPGLAALWQVLELDALVLRPHPQPRVSILVDFRFPLPELHRLLDELTQSRQAPPFETLLLVAPGERPLASGLATRWSGIRIVPVADGFGSGLSDAVEQAAGDWLLIISSDRVQPSDWLLRLLQTAEREPESAAICAKILGGDGRLIAAGELRTDETPVRWLEIGAGGDPRAAEYNYLREVDAGSNACLLLNRRAVGAALAADSAISTFAELCDGLRQLGRSVLYQPEVRVILDTSAPVPDRRPRLLVIDAIMLTPDQDSGSLRMSNLLDSFLDLGWHVVFVPANLEFHAPYGSALQRRGVEVLSLPRIDSIPEVLAQRGTGFDLVILSRLDVAERFLDTVRQHAPQAKVWFDTVDLHFLREQREAELRADPVARQQAQARQRQEIDLMRWSDLTLVVSSSERALLAREAPEVRVEILSNIHDLHPTATAFDERDAILFIGGFNHVPNVDAVLYYVCEILPHVLAALGAVPTYLIGSNPPPEIRALDNPERNLHVVGYIADVTPFFARARLSIAPLRYGAGVKGKINMSMAYGVPVVATPCAAEGMFLNPEQDILLGSDAPDFAAAVARLYRDRSLWETLARHGLTNIETHFSRHTARATLERLLAERDPERDV